MKQTILTVTIAGFMAVTGCSGDQSAGEEASSQAVTEPNGLTEFEQVHGIGPVTEEIEIRRINMEMAERGREIFEIKCSACHKMGERYVGPALGDILENRSPAYVMNMVLNPEEMVKRHPEAKKKLAEFMAPMPNQNLKRDEARAVVEYLATVHREQERPRRRESERE